MIFTSYFSGFDGLNAKAADLTVWGTGNPRREFLVFLIKHYSGPVQVNVGTGEELTIRELAETVARVVGFEEGISFDVDKLDHSDPAVS